MERPQRPPDLAFQVDGMMCQQNCATTVQRAISTVEGVEYVEVSFPNAEALVWGGNVAVQEIINEVEAMGYDATLKVGGDDVMEPEISPDITLALKGMFDSERCPKKVFELVSPIDGVSSVKVDFNKKLCYIWGFAEVPEVIEALAREGYGAKEANQSSNRQSTTKAAVVKAKQPQHQHEQKLLFNLDKLVRIASLSTIESKLRSIPHVVSVQSDVEGRTVTVFCAQGADVKETVMESVKKLKYTDALIMTSATVETNSGKTGKHEYIFDVTGMSCAACAARVEKAIFSLTAHDHPPAQIAVSAMTNKAKVVILDAASQLGPRTIAEKVSSVGYGCTLNSIDNVSVVSGDSSAADAAQADELTEWYLPLIVSVLLGVPVMTLHLSMSYSEELMMMLETPCACHGGVNYMHAIMFWLNLPILLFVGHRYYRGAVVGAMHGSYGMDCLVTTGTLITFVYSCVELALSCASHVPSKHVFFETTGMLLMFVTVGKYIEAYAKRRSFAAISNLLKLQPREAVLVVSGLKSMQESSSGGVGNTGGSTKAAKGVSSSPLRHHSTTAASTGADTASDKHTPSKAAALTSPPGDAPTTEVTKVISLDLVQRGDVLKVFPGDRVPTDGVVLQGSSFVDESMITGESLPVMKRKGDVVFGSTVNQNNLLYVRVTSLGSESALAQIVKLVEAAQMNKAPVQAYADRVAGVFTPIILVLASVTFVVWCSLSVAHIVPARWYNEESNSDPYLFSMIFAISVVVISCPCALGLATPTAIMAGTSVGAANGILIKGGGAFETAHKIDTIIFDKTGTLTEGKPAVTDVIALRPQRKGSISPAHILDESSEQQQPAQDEVLRLAAIAEQSSDHPLSRAILDAARLRHLDLPALAEDATQHFVGSGVRCETAEGVVLVGNRALMDEQHVNVGPLLDATMWDLEIQGKTAVCVAVDGVIRGVLGLADTPKGEAYSTIRALRAMNMDVWMVTGDNRTTAEALAEELDLPKDRILAGVLPKDKVTKVQELEAQGRYVAMIGDGINDSPALAQAHLGIAIGAGTEVAIEAADMVLIRSNLHDLVVALDLARLVFKRIQQNFVWAMIYNILAVPYAAGIWYPWTHMALPPQYAGLAMAASSVSVVVSSMALWLYRRPASLTAEDSAALARAPGGVLQQAQRGLVSLKNKITDKFSGAPRRPDGSAGIAMSTLKSHSAGSLTTVGSTVSGAGGGVYSQLASSEMEADTDLDCDVV